MPKLRLCRVAAASFLFFAIVSKVMAAKWTTVPGTYGLMGYATEDVSAPPSPPLNIHGNIVLSWPTTSTNLLETSTNLIDWTPQPVDSPVTNGANRELALEPNKSQQFFRLRRQTTFDIPVFEFAIFYNSLLEFTWAAPMKVNGRVHANGDIFVGSVADLTFNSIVTATGGIYKTNWDNHALATMTGAINYNGPTAYVTNVPPLTPSIGTNDSPEAMHAVIEIPPLGEDPNSPMGQHRYYNKAEVVILVTDGNVTATLKSSPTDPSPVILTATFTDGTYSPTQQKVVGGDYSNVTNTFPFISLNQSFTDQRENRVVIPTQLDVGRVVTWLNGSVVQNKFPPAAGVYPNIFYVVDLRSRTASQLPAVRLVNGKTIPQNPTMTGIPTGWTLATPDPLYVQGDFNNPSGVEASATPDPNRYPASLVTDALTILSGRWNDAASTGFMNKRVAQDTTINAAILTGIVYTTATTWTDDTHYSGGVNNFPRLLENWSNGAVYTLTLNTSMVNFFGSQIATNFFRNPGDYYSPPNRNFNFDTNFTDPNKLPPGTPMLPYVH